VQLLPFYSFDSGVFINGRRDIFIPTSFPGLWRQIEEMIALGQVRAVDEVKREVARHDDETANWAKAQRGLFVPLTRHVQEATSSVLEKHPKLNQPRKQQEQRRPLRRRAGYGSRRDGGYPRDPQRETP
jgi:hypothetical protein